MIAFFKDDRLLSWVIPILAGAILIFGFWWKGDFEQVSNTLLLICGAVLILLALFTQLSRYYYGLLFLLPLSIDTVLPGEAKLSFPSEAMLALLIPVSLLFNRDYRQAIKEALTHPLTILLLVDLFFLFFISLFSTQIDVSLKRVFIRVLFFLGFFMLMQLFEDKRKLIWPWIIYALGLLPVMYFTLRRHARYDFDPKVVFNICEPYYTDHTIYGACIAFVLPMIAIVLYKRKLFGISRIMLVVLWITFGMLIVSEVLALSRAALLSLLVAGGFALLLKYRFRFSHLMVGFFIAGAAVWGVHEQIYSSLEENESVSNDGEIVNHFSSVTNVTTDASNLERVNRWICAWRMFEERPFTGFGPGTYQFEYNKFQTLINKTYISTNSGNRGNAHSEYLTYLSETGLVGFLVFIGIVLLSIYVGMKNHYDLPPGILRAVNLGVLLGLVTFYFHGLFNSFIDQSKMAFLVFSALGTLVWIQTRKSEA